MFMKTVNTIAAGIVMILLITSVSVQAQSLSPKKEKTKRSALLNEKLADKKFVTQGMMKSAADNDLTGWIEQYYDGEEWTDEYQAEYEYSSDRLEITQTVTFFDGEEWVEDEVTTIHYNSEGYPVYISYSFFGSSLEQEFYYSAEGRLDSAKYWEAEEGEVIYEELISLDYITADSIDFYYVFMDEGELVTELAGYFLNKNDDFIEYYYGMEFDDRYTYSDISFDEYMKGIFDEFFFAEVYNDEYYHEGEEWIPFSRTTNTVEEGRVAEILEEYYSESWGIQNRYELTYNNNVLTEKISFYPIEQEWFNDTKINYSYGSGTSSEQIISVPESFRLSQNYPNPFNPVTQITYEIPSSERVLLEVYNVLGERVSTLVNTRMTAGSHTVAFDASGLASGIYYYKLVSGQHQEVRSMTLIK